MLIQPDRRDYPVCCESASGAFGSDSRTSYKCLTSCASLALHLSGLRPRPVPRGRDSPGEGVNLGFGKRRKFFEQLLSRPTIEEFDRILPRSKRCDDGCAF